MREEILNKLLPINEEEKELLAGKNQIDRSIYMENDLGVINSKKLLAAGKLISVRAHPRFVYFPKHTHDFVEVIYMCQGHTTHVVNGTTIELNEGDLLFLNQNATQEILPANQEDIAINFIILPAFFDNSLRIMGEEETPLRKFIVSCLTGGKTAGYLHFKVADVLPIQNLVENLIWVLINDMPNKRKINQITMDLLFVHLINHADKLLYQSQDDGVIIRVLKYIEEHYAECSLTDCAAALHYNVSWLSREIKEKTGENYTDLVQEKRLSQATFFLKNTDMNIKEIALSIGYKNTSFFHRIFIKKFGRTPAQYRKDAQ